MFPGCCMYSILLESRVIFSRLSNINGPFVHVEARRTRVSSLLFLLNLELLAGKNGHSEYWRRRPDDSLTKEMEEELKRVVLECGKGILEPGDSVEELLRKLDAVFELKPAKEALISNALLRHDEVDVRVTVVSCITEIIRMTAPNEPFNEDQMKDYFKLVNTAYRKLPSMAGRNHAKAVSIIQAVSACQI